MNNRLKGRPSLRDKNFQIHDFSIPRHQRLQQQHARCRKTFSCKNLCIWSTNIRGLQSNYDSLRHVLEVSPDKPQLMFLCETLIQPKSVGSGAFPISGFTCIRRDRSTGFGGGLAVYHHDDIAVSIIKSSRRLEIMWIHARIHPHDLIFGLCYHPPSASSQPFFDELDADLEILRGRYPRAKFQIIGDLNMHNRAWLPVNNKINEAGRLGEALRHKTTFIS